jgi:hypothetical protein
VDSVVVEALRQELDGMDKEEAPDIEFVRAGLEAFRE